MVANLAIANLAIANLAVAQFTDSMVTHLIVVMRSHPSHPTIDGVGATIAAVSDDPAIIQGTSHFYMMVVAL